MASSRANGPVAIHGDSTSTNPLPRLPTNHGLAHTALDKLSTTTFVVRLAQATEVPAPKTQPLKDFHKRVQDAIDEVLKRRSWLLVRLFYANERMKQLEWEIGENEEE